MTRKLKVLCACLLAVTAVGAITAGPAQATPVFEASSYPVTFGGANTKGVEQITTEAGSIECDSSFSGSASAASSTIELQPTYSNCEAFGFLEATVDVEGCSYLYHYTEKTKADIYDSHVDIVCPSGKAIKITAATCAVEIRAQTGITTMTWVVVTPDNLRVTPRTKELAYTVTKDGFLCPFNGTGNKSGGEYTGGETTISSETAQITITGE